MALNLEENCVSAVLLGNDVGISEGSLVKRTGKVVSVPVGEAMIGRVVNALGQPIDAKGPIVTSEIRPIEQKAHGIVLDEKVVEAVKKGDVCSIKTTEVVRRGDKLYKEVLR
jgi:F-type H+-transporting ATPase subunit alpha